MEIVFPEVFVFIWQVKGKEARRDEKFDVSLSEDGLTYTLKIKDVKVSDTGDYTISIGDLTATVTLFIERTDYYFIALLFINSFFYVYFLVVRLCYVLVFPKGLRLPLLVELAFLRKQTSNFRFSEEVAESVTDFCFFLP